MSFRKRNLAVQGRETSNLSLQDPLAPDSIKEFTPQISQGVRPSPLDGRPTTSTGIPSLDSLLAGNAGLVLGNSILLEEAGTTDYAGTVLRYFAAEGIVQGHSVHVVGVDDAWGRQLPGLVGAEEDRSTETKRSGEKMKIAWRYEGLGDFGKPGTARGGKF